MTTATAEKKAPKTKAPKVAKEKKIKEKKIKTESNGHVTRKIPFNILMKSRLPDGSLRKGHNRLLTTLSDAKKGYTKKEVAEQSGLGLRATDPAIQFLVEEKLVKEEQHEGEPITFVISAKGKAVAAKISKE